VINAVGRGPWRHYTRQHRPSAFARSFVHPVIWGAGTPFFPALCDKDVHRSEPSQLGVGPRSFRRAKSECHTHAGLTVASGGSF
jgi:hypothetical protein